jgi:hypothetical protein
MNLFDKIEAGFQRKLQKELLPCPFCDSKNLNENFVHSRIQCMDCRAAGPASRDGQHVHAWNNRPKPQPEKAKKK